MLWGTVYLDDAAATTWQALRFLEGKQNFLEAFLIAADDTRALAPTQELLQRFFPDVPAIRFGQKLGVSPYTGLYSNARAREHLGFRPTKSAWRENVTWSCCRA